MEENRSKYDFILFDSPALLSSPDSAVFVTVLDGVILLARYGKTRRADLLEANKKIQSAHVPVWGTVLYGAERISVPWWDIIDPWGQRLLNRFFPGSQH